jgi:hypothetical protein
LTCDKRHLSPKGDTEAIVEARWRGCVEKNAMAGEVSGKAEGQTGMSTAVHSISIWRHRCFGRTT